MMLIVDTLYSLGSSMLVKRCQYEKGNIRKYVHGEIVGLCRSISFHKFWSKPTDVEHLFVCAAPTVNNIVTI